MAQIVGVFYASHSNFCYRKPEDWNRFRGRRSLKADVPMDDEQTNLRKFERIQAGMAAIKRKLTESAPDVIVVYGDDQGECFDFRNYPPFAIYVGDSFEGHFTEADLPAGEQPPATARRRLMGKGHSAFATSLLTGLLKRGFDPAYCMDSPKPAPDIGHAFMRPLQSLTNGDTPIVPVFINAFFAPQPSAARCYALGKAVRELVEAMPENLRVALVGSGGLWHTPNAKGAWLDEAFDKTILDHLVKGDVKGMAAAFDNYRVPAWDTSQDISVRGAMATGLPGVDGPQSGTREICNWVAASAAVEGRTTTVVDCVPVYASPCNVAFAYANL